MIQSLVVTVLYQVERARPVMAHSYYEFHTMNLIANVQQ